MRVFKTEAIVLRRTNYGEADRILNLLTLDRGKISAIARGVRKSKSKLAGGLELFATCSISVAEGKGDMGLMTSARLIRFYGNILHDYDRMQLGYECIKLINRAAETVTEPDFYYLLRDGFLYLDNLSISHNLIELWFRLHFMSLLGQDLNTQTTETAQRLQVDRRYNFDFQNMAFVEHENGQFNAGHIKLLRLAKVKNPAILEQIKGLEAVLHDCLWLVRTVEL